MSPTTTRAHVARAAVDSVSHQICDIVDVIEQLSGPLHLFRADGGATASALVVQTQADLLGREVQVSEVAEVPSFGAAKLAGVPSARAPLGPPRAVVGSISRFWTRWSVGDAARTGQARSAEPRSIQARAASAE